MRMRVGKIALLLVLGTGLSGCHTLHKAWRSCANEDKVLANAQSIPGLKVPAGIDPPDTKSGMKIPELNEPAPPARDIKDPCLDEPPKYVEPGARGAKPVPAA